ncbi:hypothetical protein P7F88_25590 [Vibrio hannami]|uniref:hypothetical protein n=1 Tax=Vibrio hannami TaxID=2717094 RepID=UPI00240FB111|nr:hypothetical protein [Vibrio hannami]MDG3089240.1 hypothetical protein [Vibrio hannami]
MRTLGAWPSLGVGILSLVALARNGNWKRSPETLFVCSTALAALFAALAVAFYLVPLSNASWQAWQAWQAWTAQGLGAVMGMYCAIRLEYERGQARAEPSN